MRHVEVARRHLGELALLLQCDEVARGRDGEWRAPEAGRAAKVPLLPVSGCAATVLFL